MTSEHRHKNDTTNGQRVSRHSLPTLLCFNFFPTAQKKLNFYCNRTNGTFGFFPHTSQRSKNQKSHFLANARTERPTIKLTLRLK